jgi:hypothetical protein
VFFSERRFQPVWILLFALLMTSTLGVAYAAALSNLIGVVIGFTLSGIAVFAWLRARSDILVDDMFLRVGRMKIERGFIGVVTALDEAAFLQRIRSGAQLTDVLSFTSTRRGGVVVEILDENDPFRAWVIGCKSPQALAQALTDHTASV